jgi:hypothetical protein
MCRLKYFELNLKLVKIVFLCQRILLLWVVFIYNSMCIIFLCVLLLKLLF